MLAELERAENLAAGKSGRYSYLEDALLVAGMATVVFLLIETAGAAAGASIASKVKPPGPAPGPVFPQPVPI